MMTKQHVLNDLLIVYALYAIIIKNHKITSTADNTSFSYNFDIPKLVIMPFLTPLLSLYKSIIS